MDKEPVSVRLGREEARDGRLPPVCLCCGVPAVIYRTRTFARPPWWMYLGLLFLAVPYFLLVVFRTRRLRVRAPFCTVHQFHWLWRDLLLLVCVLVNLAAAVFALEMLVDLGGSARRLEQFRLVFGLAAFVGGPVGLLALAVTLRLTGVHATEVAPDAVTLTGVSPEFAEAVRVQHADEAAARDFSTRPSGEQGRE